MTSGNDWINATRNYLMSGFTEERNKLASTYTAGSGTLTFSYPLQGIRQGAKLSIGTNTFYVWSVNGQSATVSAGEDGTVDATIASGTVVRVNPRFTDADIWREIGNDLGDLSSPTNGLYGIGTVDLTYNPVLVGYDLGSIQSTFIDIYEMKYLTPGPAHDNARIKKANWRINRDANSNQFTSGFGLQLFQPAYPGFNLRVVYKSTLTVPSSSVSNVSVTGLQPSAYDLPPLGAAVRLMAGREIKRNFTESQGDTRRATEVPPSAVAQSSNGLARLRQQRITAEAARLDALYPSYR